MRIAINTRFLLPTKMEGFGWYTYEIAKRLVEMYPEHEFYFFFDRKFDPKFIFNDNIHPVVLNPPARHPILFYCWFEWSVRRALKKHKIHLFFSPDGYLSLRSSVPQIAVIHDLNFEHYPQDIPFTTRHYLRYFFPKFAKKAAEIITVSEYSKEDIAKTYSIDRQKIHAIWNGASDVFKPLSEESKITIRHQHTNGSDYFLYVGAIHPRKNLNRLMEAFVAFKSQTKSDTKLVIVGTPLWRNKSFSVHVPDEIKNEIIFTGHLAIEELAAIMGAAKAFTFIPYFEGFGIPLVEAMKCAVPILSGNLTSLPEVAGEAALYCDPFDVNDITNKLVELDRDSNLRDALSEKGLQRAQLFSWDEAAKKTSKVLGLS